jgi:hypothetical protein
MSREVEAAALAQQAGRAFTPGGSAGGLVGGGAAFGSSAYAASPPASPATSSFAEVADDDDFDLVPEVDLVDIRMRDIDEAQERRSSESVGDDDFELGDGTDYSVAGQASPPAPVPPVDATAVGASIGTQSVAQEIRTTSTENQSNGNAAPPAEDRAPPVPDVAHSVETAGDVLLDAALAEQKEAQKRAKLGRRRHRRTAVTAQAADRFLVFCPNGHRIQVQDRHRGRTGRCPSCKSLFFVPNAETNQTLGQAGGQPAAADGGPAAPDPAVIARTYTKWITDVRLHRVNPAKLKLKPGSLEAEYDAVDLGACPEHLLVAVVYSGSGPFRAMQEPKKKPVTRKAMLDHLAANKPLAELPIPRSIPLTPELLTQLKIVQPPVPGEESLFADVPVFGVGKIALRLPAADVASERAYLSFTLSQFRALSQTLSEIYGLAEYGSGTSIPLNDSLSEAACHYSDAVLSVLGPDRLEYYRADPAIKLVVLGRRCQKCGLVVSEESRRKEKIGGKSDTSVAKALCPKCKSKFGDMILYGIAPSK